jgi:hypothetical protein
VRRREGGEKTCNHKTKGTRAAFVRLKKINARVKKSEGVRVRARQERERERKHSHSPSWEDSPPRRATLRRSCLPLWKRVSFKNADFLKKKTSHSNIS